MDADRAVLRQRQRAEVERAEGREAQLRPGLVDAVFVLVVQLIERHHLQPSHASSERDGDGEYRDTSCHTGLNMECAISMTSSNSSSTR